MSEDQPQNLGSREPTNGTQPGEAGRKKAGNLRSKIAFPYGSLKDAEHIATELHSKWGDSASPDQVASGLDSTPRSGAFRMKVATARTFGLVSVSRGEIALTDLGRRIVDPQARPKARVDAFLRVPLFQAVFEAYKGSRLPPDQGLEKKMADLGVSSKQTDKARQALQRSADLAGFLQQGRDRLVEPPNMGDSGRSPTPEDSTEDHLDMTQMPVTGSVPLPDLWLKLLREGHSWSAQETHEYVEAARKLVTILAKS